MIKVMETTLDDLKNSLSMQLFGITAQEAKDKGICVSCREPAYPKCYSEAGRREYLISGLCEECFDAITK